MRRLIRLVGNGFVIFAVAYAAVPARAQTPDDDSLRIYAVNVVKTPPFKMQFTGYGIYLGRGIIITAAHVVGRWSFFTRPRVLIAGQDLPAKVIKEGSFEQTDLALLSVDEEQLPVALRLRRNPLCKSDPKVGEDVINVAPDGIVHSRVVSPLLIAPELRRRFGTLIETEARSGSGLFDADRKCLLGIMSAKVQKRQNQIVPGQFLMKVRDFAGYFVPAAKIISFLPPDLRF
jgi:hypothetical protein